MTSFLPVKKMMNPTPLYLLQHQLLHIIDSACVTDRTSQYAYDCLNSLTNFIKSGQYNRPEGFKLPSMTPMIPALALNQLSAMKTNRIQAPSAEVERVENRLSGFDYKESPAWYAIREQFTSDVKQVHLRRIAEHIAQKLQINLDRDAKRRKTVLLKWFDENWKVIKDVIYDYTVVSDIPFYQHVPIATKEEMARIL